MVLAVPLAFLWRHARAHGFLLHELAGIGAIYALILAFPFVGIPVGFFALLIAAALTVRRVTAGAR